MELGDLHMIWAQQQRASPQLTSWLVPSNWRSVYFRAYIVRKPSVSTRTSKQALADGTEKIARSNLSQIPAEKDAIFFSSSSLFRELVSAFALLEIEQRATNCTIGPCKIMHRVLGMIVQFQLISHAMTLDNLPRRTCSFYGRSRMNTLQWNDIPGKIILIFSEHNFFSS